MPRTETMLSFYFLSPNSPTVLPSTFPIHKLSLLPTVLKLQISRTFLVLVGANKDKTTSRQNMDGHRRHQRTRPNSKVLLKMSHCRTALARLWRPPSHLTPPWPDLNRVKFNGKHCKKYCFEKFIFFFIHILIVLKKIYFSNISNVLLTHSTMVSALNSSRAISPFPFHALHEASSSPDESDGDEQKKIQLKNNFDIKIFHPRANFL